MFGQLTHFKMFAPPGDYPYALARYQSEAKRLYEVLDKRLATSAYLGGAEYSIADMRRFRGTRNHDLHGASWTEHPHLARWFNEISARPAVKRTLAKIADIKTSAIPHPKMTRTVSSAVGAMRGSDYPGRLKSGHASEIVAIIGLNRLSPNAGFADELGENEPFVPDFAPGVATRSLLPCAVAAQTL